jgi:hypothetical protein
MSTKATKTTTLYDLRDKVVLSPGRVTTEAWELALLTAEYNAQSVPKFQFMFGKGRLSVDLKAFQALILELKGISNGDESIGLLELVDKCTFIQPVPAKSNSNKMFPCVSPALVGYTTNWPSEAIFPGVIALIGDRFAGKTYHIRHHMNDDAKGNHRPIDAVIRVGEPLEQIDLDENAYHVGDIVDAFSLAIVLGALGWTVAIDSIRKLVYSLDGSAMEGGVIAVLFDLMTDMNNVVSLFSANIVIAINPMMGDDAKIERFYERMAASCCGAILMMDQHVASHTYRGFGGRINTNLKFAEHDPRVVSDREGSHIDPDSFKKPDWMKENDLAEYLTDPSDDYKTGLTDEDDDTQGERQGVDFRL